MTTTTSIDPKKPIPTPPLNWRKEMPVYRVSGETRPAPKTRFRFEPPFAQIMDPSEWQYGEKICQRTRSSLQIDGHAPVR
jgi:hypothetical protein